ncbi:MAG: SDR family NAD(P)-dependent oxidoreductase [Sphaerochaetaceae bacterium]
MDIAAQQVFSLKGKVALITGGASGIGFAIAKCLTGAGARIIITGTRNISLLQDACKEIGPFAEGYCCDITSESEVDALVASILSVYGHVDILVNNAGVHCKKPFEELAVADFQRVFDVHLLGAFYLTSKILPSMKVLGSGNIIFISSLSAFLGMTQVAAYASAKSAVLGMTRSLAGEVSEYGIRVNALVPGFIDTSMFRLAIQNDSARQEKIINHTPMRRLGSPEDIGWAALYLASDASSFVTGIALPVDGGCVIGF